MINAMLVVAALQASPALERAELLDAMPGRVAVTVKLAMGSVLATGALSIGAAGVYLLLPPASDGRAFGAIGLAIAVAVGLTGIWMLASGSLALQERHRIELRLAQLVLPEHTDRLPPAPPTLGWAWSI